MTCVCEQCICKSDDLIFAGRRPSQLTKDEAIAAAKHFRTVAYKQFHQLAELGRRMGKLEEAVPKSDIAKLDGWLKAYPLDLYRGDGAMYYADWKKYELPVAQRQEDSPI
jgi:hypothetical protein